TSQNSIVSFPLGKEKGRKASKVPSGENARLPGRGRLVRRHSSLPVATSQSPRQEVAAGSFENPRGGPPEETAVFVPSREKATLYAAVYGPCSSRGICRSSAEETASRNETCASPRPAVHARTRPSGERP